MGLEGKIALVTGGSRGIGRGICEAFAARGMRIIVNYARNAGAAEATARSCRELGGQAVAVQGDVGKREDVARLFDECLNHFGGLDILVNNAGVETVAPFEFLGETDWDYVFDTNVKGVYLCSQQAVKLMRDRGRGVIVNITSLCGQQAWTGYSHYCASKAAADMLTKCMAMELAPLDITVNGIAPGTVDTDMTRADISEASEIEAVIQRTPTRRLGTVEDVAAVVMFLCDQASDWLTGEVITIDGGYRLSGDPIPT